MPRNGRPLQVTKNLHHQHGYKWPDAEKVAANDEPHCLNGFILATVVFHLFGKIGPIP